jgi:hypothetical protein
MNGLGLIIESLVAILLALTIGYSILLNRRLKLLKADEQSLRATISELVTATEIAERAIGGLRITASECEVGLGSRLARAERLSGELDRGVAAAKDLLERFAHLTKAEAAINVAPARPQQRQREAAASPRQESRQESRQEARQLFRQALRQRARLESRQESQQESRQESRPPARPDAKAVAVAAHAFAERLRLRVHGLAA